MKKLIVQGGDFRRRTGATIVAVSSCSLALRSEKYIEPCETAFIQFENILRDRDDREIKYEWENVYRKGVLIRFTVNWYDLDFYSDRKEAYRVGPHAFALQRFGASVNDLKVRHRLMVRQDLGDM